LFDPQEPQATALWTVAGDPPKQPSLAASSSTLGLPGHSSRPEKSAKSLSLADQVPIFVLPTAQGPAEMLACHRSGGLFSERE